MSSITKKLLKRERIGNLRQLSFPKKGVDFSSNDYLGLSQSSKLNSSIFNEWSHLTKVGSTGSRLLTGNSVYAEELERKIAGFHGFESGVLFSCGYMANIGLLSSISSAEDTLLYDIGIHASMREGIRLSESRSFPFRHNDIEHLEVRLKNRSKRGHYFICIESIYSTDGSLAPLQSICLLAKKYHAYVIVDEAHSVGVFGPGGAGLVAKHALHSDVFAQVVTFGKALGTYGAIVLGSKTLQQALINFASSYIYTTALPQFVLATIKCSYDLFPKLDKERQHLHTLVESCPFSSTHIQPIPVPGNSSAKILAHFLGEKGFEIKPLLSPTVQRGQEVLRLCLHSFNSRKELENFSKVLRSFRDE